ncbi:hypothetical protein BLNAU_12591 [Blattamonas nauphoetae]|uniref:Uncharacterized protein n=1 Tax=Blattamonas nauphoetae TaxID=2049346 RepID=A0ABQ9XMP8_9EUKA|nr:hypothetical protein BLNAU_12591 [Blattamonas nauphoetae]
MAAFSQAQSNSALSAEWTKQTCTLFMFLRASLGNQFNATKIISELTTHSGPNAPTLLDSLKSFLSLDSQELSEEIAHFACVLIMGVFPGWKVSILDSGIFIDILRATHVQNQPVTKVELHASIIQLLSWFMSLLAAGFGNHQTRNHRPNGRSLAQSVLTKALQPSASYLAHLFHNRRELVDKRTNAPLASLCFSILRESAEDPKMMDCIGNTPLFTLLIDLIEKEEDNNALSIYFGQLTTILSSWADEGPHLRTAGMALCRCGFSTGFEDVLETYVLTNNQDRTGDWARRGGRCSFVPFGGNIRKS